MELQVIAAEGVWWSYRVMPTEGVLVTVGWGSAVHFVTNVGPLLTILSQEALDQKAVRRYRMLHNKLVREEHTTILLVK